MQPTLPAQSKKHTYLKMHFNKIAYRRCREAAVTAVARKIAVIVWHMLTNKVGYTPIDSSIYNNRMKQKKIKKQPRIWQNLTSHSKNYQCITKW